MAPARGGTLPAMRTVAGPTDSVVVVGAGLGGLSAALHLAGAGRHVTVLERAPLPGGRAGMLRDHGYIFDTGPTVLTMPELVQQAFEAVGEDLQDWLTLHRLDPAYRARFADGSSLDVHTDVDAMSEEIAATCGPQDAAGYRRFVAYLHELFALEMPHFIDRNLDSPLQLAGRPLLRLLRAGGFRRLDTKVAQFFADPRLRRVFSFQSMYAGLAPSQALALYAVITYMDCVRGVWFPEGGMHAVPRALAGAAAAHGVSFRHHVTVTAIEIAGNRARAVITEDGDRIPADVVVVNADLPVAMRDLLPPGYTPRRVRRLRYSPSAAVLHVGSSAAYPGAAHHTVDFGAEWDRTFTELVGQGRLMSDPSFLVSTPTVTDPSLAPAGRHTYYVLFPVPNLVRGRIDWAGEGPRYKEHMLDTLEARGFAGFRDGIECAHLVTPADWAAQGLAAGAPFAAAHTVPADRPVPAGHPRPPGGEPRLHRLEHPAGCGGADGADLRAARRGAGDRTAAMSPARIPPLAARELDAAGIRDPALREGYLRCRRLNARHGRTYYLATLLLPAGRRPYVHALYGFARHTDDIVDGRGGERSRFPQWCADVLAELDWGSTGEPIRRALLDTLARWQIPHSYVADFLDSMQLDLTVRGYATWDDLLRYMWGSAAVIGLEMLPVLGRADETVPWDRLESPAIDLGYAFQLTNFLRDVAEDLRRGRVYLPQESLDQFGVDRERLRRGRVDEPIRNLLAWEVERARGLYRRAEPGIDLVHPSARDCLRTALTLYEGILDEIERADYDVFSGRVAVPLSRRGAVGLAGLRRAVRARRAAPTAPA